MHSIRQSVASFDCAGAEFQTLLGMATPPTSYGGYGGNANEKPKYSFEYPTGWKTEVPSKVLPVTAAAAARNTCNEGRSASLDQVAALSEATDKGRSAHPAE